ncbi:MAG: FUSC family protein [Bizionia sp.]|nr:FUSC family protein [Bizionia sp.]
MRLIYIILGLITSILAVILAILPGFIVSFIPAILAIIFGLLGFLKSKKEHKPTHTTQLIFLLTIIALAIASYQSVYSTTYNDETEHLELQEAPIDKVEIIGGDIDITN